MPEGDTVYAAADRLRRALAGRVLTHCQFRVPRYATVDFTGHTVTGVRSRGKHLLIDLADPQGARAPSIHSHLKMEGAWHVYRPGARWRRPTHHARIVLRTNICEAVGFELGVLDLLDDPESALSYLGPDLLGDDWDADEAVRRIRARPAEAIGLALLDQRLMAGVGNVFRCEICFLRGVLPTTPVADVDVPGMVETSRKLLWNNRTRTARSTTGQTAPNARTWVYGRRGQLCRRCATPIERGFLGDDGAERVIYFCPTCQR